MKEWPSKAVCNKDWFIDCSVDLLLQFPDNLPCSVALQPAAHDVGKVRTWRRNRSDEVNASQDGDTSSLFFFCSNVPWSLRSKRSALRARTLKYANGESQREAWGVHRQLHLPLNRRRTVAEWKKISLLTFQFFIWLFVLFPPLRPTGAWWSWCSGRSSTLQKAREWRPLLKPPGTSSCRTNRFMSRPVWTKRWDAAQTLKTQHDTFFFQRT